MASQSFGDRLTASDFEPGHVQNYKSFHDAGDIADKEVERLERLGYIECRGSWQEVTATWPHATLVPVG
eukprot:568078-Amphidinium_carterae.1